MGKIRVYVVNLILFTMVVICHGLALAAGSYSAEENQVHMLYWKSEHITGESAMEMQEKNRNSNEEKLNFTVWGSRKKQAVNFAEYGRTAEAEVFYLCGDSRLMFDGSAYIDEDDRNGCLISSDIAYDLFGNSKVKDVSIEYQGKEYIVRGLLTDRQNSMVIQAGRSAEDILDAVAIEVPGNRLADSVINMFEGRYNAADMIVNPAAVPLWGNLIAGLLPLVMFITLLIPAIKKITILKQTPVKCMVWIIGIILFSLIYWWVSGMKFQLPFTVSPSKWSDFSYWRQLLEKESEAIWNFIIMEKRGPERIYTEKLFETVKYTILSLASFIIMIRGIEVKRFADWFIFSVSSIICAFIAVLMAAPNQAVIAGHSGLWIMPLVYLMGLRILK